MAKDRLLRKPVMEPSCQSQMQPLPAAMDDESGQ
jgi:hypothetical protein